MVGKNAKKVSSGKDGQNAMKLKRESHGMAIELAREA
jgi:hypothetical protein